MEVVISQKHKPNSENIGTYDCRAWACQSDPHEWEAFADSSILKDQAVRMLQVHQLYVPIPSPFQQYPDIFHTCVQLSGPHRHNNQFKQDGKKSMICMRLWTISNRERVTGMRQCDLVTSETSDWNDHFTYLIQYKMYIRFLS